MRHRRTKRFVVIGLGTFGSGTATALYQEGHDVIAVDLKEEAVDRMFRHVSRGVVGDGTSADLLERIGASEADAAIVCTGDNLTGSILAVLGLKDLGVSQLFVKVVSRDHARLMQKLGVTEIIFPERESSINLARRITQSDAVLNHVRLGSGFSLQEMVLPEAWAGRTLRELNLRASYHVSIVAVRNDTTDKMNPVPDPNEVLSKSSTVLVAGSDEHLARILDPG